MQIDNATAIPRVTIQIVHLDGPKQGQIDEFTQSRVSIGRDKICDVQTNANARTVSRKHAEIIRDGNRFLFINHGQNGSIVNGKRVDQTTLQAGDIIELTQNGPRISFLSQFASPEVHTLPVLPNLRGDIAKNDPAVSRGQLPQETAFTIQYGTYVRTVRKTHCRFGRDNRADFVIEHPSVHAFHAEVVYKGNEFFLRDLTGTATTTVNQRDARVELILNKNDIIELGRHGPQFRYIGDGRFVEFQLDRSTYKQEVNVPVFDFHLAFSNTHDDFDKPRGVVGWFKNQLQKFNQ